MGNLVLSLAGLAARLLPLQVKKAFYRFPALARFIRQNLNRAAPVGLVRVKVAGGNLVGMDLLLDLQSEKDYWLGTYEPELQAALANFTQQGWIAYDAGANIGYLSLLLARLVGPQGRVFAFEASPDNLGRLEKNVDMNGLADRVTIVPLAVADRSGEIRFLVGPSGGMGKVEGSAGRQGVAYAGSIAVQGTSLDDFIFFVGNPAPDLVKMDIEGGEVLALPGMRRTLETARPVVFLELHGPEAAQAAWDTFKKTGYTLHEISSSYPKVRIFEDLQWKAYLLALPDRLAHSQEGKVRDGVWPRQ